MKKGGGNWVDGDKFFNREQELRALEERVRDGTHTLLTAQRRMGKTSLVRELQRRLQNTGEFETVFVDLEAARDTADAIAEIAVRSKSVCGAWDLMKKDFTNFFRGFGGRIEELSISDLKVKLRAGIDAGNWQQRGNDVFAALAASDRPVVLAIDELPILVQRLLHDESGNLVPEGKRNAEELLSWLRMNGQEHRNRISIILSGSVGLEPILEQVGLSAQANIYSAYDLKPWSEETAVACLEALAKSYDVCISPEISREMCRRLRCCIPHHVQMFFDRMHEHLRHADRKNASSEDLVSVYKRDMLGVRGQVDLQHYENRLKKAVGEKRYPIALELLTATAVGGKIDGKFVNRYRNYFSTRDGSYESNVPSVNSVLHVLEHDGYLERQDGSYRFISGLLEDWWRRRYGQHFVSLLNRKQ